MGAGTYERFDLRSGDQNARPGPLLRRVDHAERAQDLASAIRDSAATFDALDRLRGSGLVAVQRGCLGGRLQLDRSSNNLS
jgi:hypothetical protein